MNVTSSQICALKMPRDALDLRISHDPEEAWVLWGSEAVILDVALEFKVPYFNSKSVTSRDHSNCTSSGLTSDNGGEIKLRNMGRVFSSWI
jgi:hypothetical protein